MPWSRGASPDPRGISAVPFCNETVCSNIALRTNAPRGMRSFAATMLPRFDMNLNTARPIRTHEPTANGTTRAAARPGARPAYRGGRHSASVPPPAERLDMLAHAAPAAAAMAEESTSRFLISSVVPNPNASTIKSIVHARGRGGCLGGHGGMCRRMVKAEPPSQLRIHFSTLQIQNTSRRGPGVACYERTHACTHISVQIQ